MTEVDKDDDNDEKDEATGQTRAEIKKFNYHGLKIGPEWIKKRDAWPKRQRLNEIHT